MSVLMDGMDCDFIDVAWLRGITSKPGESERMGGMKRHITHNAIIS